MTAPACWRVVCSGFLAVFLGHAASWGQVPGPLDEPPQRQRRRRRSRVRPQRRPAAARPAARNIQIAVPRSFGRLRSADIGLVINSRDPYSVAVGEYYAARRGLRAAQVLRVDLPVQGDLPLAEFETLRTAVAERFGPNIQALALAWTAPWAVGCNSITGALALGYDEDLCRNTCAPSKPSPYANTGSARPFTDFGMRPSMLIAARSVEQAKALIDRGVRSDGQLATRARPACGGRFSRHGRRCRNVRRACTHRRVHAPGRRGVAHDEGLSLAGPDKVILVQTGLARLAGLDEVDWAPGGLGDHLTSFGGRMLADNGQSTVLEWIDSGATASHGTVSEPCNHLQKFPHPMWLLLHYLQGGTASRGPIGRA